MIHLGITPTEDTPVSERKWTEDQVKSMDELIKASSKIADDVYGAYNVDGCFDLFLGKDQPWRGCRFTFRDVRRLRKALQEARAALQRAEGEGE